MGVPRTDGYFGKCNPKNSKNYRSRCSALIKTKDETILIDTSPDLRQQLINNKIKNIDNLGKDTKLFKNFMNWFIFKIMAKKRPLKKLN